MSTKAKNAVYVGACFMFAAWLAMHFLGCASALDRARQVVSTAATLERSTGEMLIEIDRDTQNDIAAELDRTRDVTKALAERDAWRVKRKQIRQALMVTHATVVAGSVATELAASGQPVDLSTVIANGIKAMKALSDALKSFGLALPGGIL
jgi:hypothetical protein